MSFTFEQVNLFIILAILGAIIYMLIYRKKGLNKSILGYFHALSNSITVGVIAIFIIVAVFIVKICITQPLYPGLIVPIGWLFISYFCIKRILKKDFGVNMQIFNPNLKVFNMIKNNYIVIMLGGLVIGMGFFTYMILFKVLPDGDNQPYGSAPIFVVGMFFLITTIVLARVVYLKITGKIKFVEITESQIDNSTRFTIERTNKVKTTPRDGTPRAMLIFIMIIGILLVAFGMKINGDIKDKGANYLETIGYFIDEELYSKDSENGDTYYLTYYYEVNGIGYTVSTDYGTAFVPEYGTEQIIRYNPYNPGEAIIEGNNSSMILYFIGTFFITIPTIMLGYDWIVNIRNVKLRNILEFMWHMLIGMFFIGIAVGVYYVICSGSNDFSIGTAIKSAGFIIVFPVVFFIVGFYIICGTIYCKYKEIYIKRNTYQ